MISLVLMSCGLIIEKEFNSFSDTSLDCGTFYNYVKSTRFIELIRNYFFMIKSNKKYELNNLYY